MGFEEVIGHEKQKGLLLSFLKHERMPHAFLFSGQDGIGKKKTAVEFAKHILCEHGTGCGACRACARIDRGTHPDLMILSKQEGEASIGIDLIRGNEEKKVRGVNQEVYEYPYEGKKRVIIIDGAEDLTREAANALLKTLEEPPPFNVFFLITASEEELPHTIRSRCSRIFFTALRQEQLRRYFADVLSIDGHHAETLSSISFGSIGAGVFWNEKENFEMRKRLAELVTGKHKSFINATLLSQRITKNIDGVSIYLSFLLSLFRDIFVLNIYQDSSMIMNRDIREILELGRVDLRWIEESVKRIQETIRIMRYNVNKWLIFENLLLHIMRHV
ncbi:MAG TPA: DNA polymerase III subunit delta' [Syntrophorhabdaceae bacterium]|nr:DNA polymerase III subunit delta' [Syntrophorhabdaceae bacterium]HQM80982.1 DNA polymerase III subunit delta' [Syntrophorhabdaceae bacterium]